MNQFLFLVIITCSQLQDIKSRIENNSSLTPTQKTELIETIKDYSSCLKK